MNTGTKVGLGIALVGGAGYYASYKVPEAQRMPVRLGSGLAIIAGLSYSLYCLVSHDLEAIADSGGIVGGVGDIVLGTPGPSDKVKTRYYQANKAPKPTNLQRLSGALLNPTDGGIVGRNHFFGSAYPVRFDVSNWGKEVNEVEIKLVVHERNTFGTESPIFGLGRYTLPPDGGSVMVEAEAAVESLSALGLKLTGRLYANNYLLDKNDFRIT